MKKLGYLIQKALLNAAFCWIGKEKRVTCTLLRPSVSNKIEAEVDKNARRMFKNACKRHKKAEAESG